MTPPNAAARSDLASRLPPCHLSNTRVDATADLV